MMMLARGSIHVCNTWI